MKILIVEDETSLREVMTRSLEKEHYVVEQAADYMSAQQKINDYDYDCILLDIMLPGVETTPEAGKRHHRVGQRFHRRQSDGIGFGSR